MTSGTSAHIYPVATITPVDLMNWAIYTYPLFGVVPDGAGVGHDDIRLIYTLAALPSALFEYRENDLAVSHIHLATICLYIYLFHKLPQRYKLFVSLGREKKTQTCNTGRRRMPHIPKIGLSVTLPGYGRMPQFHQTLCLDFAFTSSGIRG